MIIMSTRIKLIILLILYVIFGGAISIILKFIYNQQSEGRHFYHDLFITQLMFLSEIFGLPAYYIKNHISRKYSKKENEKEKSKDKSSQENTLKELSNKKKFLIILLACCLDFLACFLSDLSLAFVGGSFAIFLKSLILVQLIFVLSWCISKKKPIIDQRIGFFFAWVTIIIICLSVFYGEKDNNEDKDFTGFIISFFMVFFAMFFQSIQSIIEENITRNYIIHQFYIIGFEGIFGFCINLFCCIISYNFKCDIVKGESKYLEKICNEDDEGIWRLENALFAIRQIFSKTALIVLIIFLIIIRFLYNLITISIIKYGGALTRGVIENIRTIVFWVFFIIPWVSEDYRESFNWLRFFGAILIIVILLLYLAVFKIDECLTIRSKIINIANLGRITIESNKVEINSEDDKEDTLNELEEK